VRRACTERNPNGHLVLPSAGAGEQKVGDVSARDQQHQKPGATEDHEDGPGGAGQLLTQRDDGDAPALSVGGVLRRMGLPDGDKPRLGGFRRNARSQARDHRRPGRARIHPIGRQGIVQQEGDQKQGVVAQQRRRRQHTNHLRRGLIQNNPATDDSGITSKPALP